MPDLHDRQPEHARHEVADRVQVLGLHRHDFGDHQWRVPAEVDDSENAGDDLIDRGRELRPRRVGRHRHHRGGTARCCGRQPGFVTGWDQHDAVDLAGLHLVRRIGRVRDDHLDAGDLRERVVQLGRGRRPVLVDVAERQVRAAALEDQPEQDDEDERKRQRPEQRSAVADVAPDVGDGEREEGMHRSRVSPAGPGRSGRGTRPRASPDGPRGSGARSPCSSVKARSAPIVAATSCV